MPFFGNNNPNRHREKDHVKSRHGVFHPLRLAVAIHAKSAGIAIELGRTKKFFRYTGCFWAKNHFLVFLNVIKFKRISSNTPFNGVPTGLLLSAVFSFFSRNPRDYDLKQVRYSFKLHRVLPDTVFMVIFPLAQGFVPRCRVSPQIELREYVGHPKMLPSWSRTWTLASETVRLAGMASVSNQCRPLITGNTFTKRFNMNSGQCTTIESAVVESSHELGHHHAEVELWV